MEGRETLKCDSSSFAGIDPLPSQDKQCFCDERKKTGVEEAKTMISRWEHKSSARLG